MNERELYQAILERHPSLIEEIRADERNKTIDEIHTDLSKEIALLSKTDLKDVDFCTFVVRIKEIADKSKVKDILKLKGGAENEQE